jgi:DNA-directed RNA polymerase alpha subunit
MNRYAPDIVYIQRSIVHYDLKKCKLLADWLAAHIQAMEIDKQQFKVSIQNLNLSARALNVLRFNNIVTIGQLLTKAVNWDEIKVLKGAGQKVLSEIKQQVDELRKINSNTQPSHTDKPY